MKPVYLCGPVTGMPNRNRDAFEETAKKLEAAGYRVSVPTRIVGESTAHADAMKICIAELLRCGGVCTLEAQLEEWKCLCRQNEIRADVGERKLEELTGGGR